MAHMQKQEYTGAYYEVDTSEGTQFVPEYVCGAIAGMENKFLYTEGDPDDAEQVKFWSDACSAVRDYVVGREINAITRCVGTLYRLSAPGYLDCTDWTTDAESPDFDDMDDE